MLRYLPFLPELGISENGETLRDGRILLVPTLPRGNAVGDAPRRLGLRSAIKQVPHVSLAEGFDDRSCRIRLEIVGLFRQAL